MKSYPIEKYRFTVDGRKVTAESSYAGKPIKGTAVCAEGDTFDFEIGKRLAATRCAAKIAEKRYKTAYTRLYQACQIEANAEKYRIKMAKYAADATEQEVEALKILEAMMRDL